MPISTSLYTELRFTISDYMQRREWARLFEVCGTSDNEASRTIAVIMSGYDPKSVWQFLDYVMNLEREARQQKRESVSTTCYVIARTGQTNVRKSLAYLRKFLLEDPEIRDSIVVALSNLWVLSPRVTSSILFNTWILKNDQSEILQEVSVNSCEYLASKDPKRVANFLRKVSILEEREIAAKAARALLKKYLPKNTQSKINAKRKKRKKEKRKKKKGKKHKKKKR